MNFFKKSDIKTEQTEYERALKDYAKEKEENPIDFDKYDEEFLKRKKIEEWEGIINSKTPGIKEYFYSTLTTNSYDDIQVIIVTKDNTYLSRESRKGSSHSRMVANMLGIDENRYNGEPVYEQNVANEFGYVIFTFLNTIDESPVYLPENLQLNEYQISELERINEEVREVNFTRPSEQKIKFNYVVYDDDVEGTLNTLIEVAKNNLEENNKTL